MPPIRHRRFLGQLPPHSGNPLVIEIQGFGYRIVDLLSHRVFVHPGEGLQRFGLQPIEPATQQVTLGGSQGSEIGNRQGPQRVQ